LETSETQDVRALVDVAFEASAQDAGEEANHDWSVAQQ